MLERKRRKSSDNGSGHTEITFVLPADAPPGPVSVVGDFNDWQPGTHELRPRKDGTRELRAERIVVDGRTIELR